MFKKLMLIHTVRVDFKQSEIIHSDEGLESETSVF